MTTFYRYQWSGAVFSDEIKLTVGEFEKKPRFPFECFGGKLFWEESKGAAMESLEEFHRVSEENGRVCFTPNCPLCRKGEIVKEVELKR